jgi:hypothetical protein
LHPALGFTNLLGRLALNPPLSLNLLYLLVVALPQCPALGFRQILESALGSAKPALLLTAQAIETLKPFVNHLLLLPIQVLKTLLLRQGLLSFLRPHTLPLIRSAPQTLLALCAQAVPLGFDLLQNSALFQGEIGPGNLFLGQHWAS